MIIFFLLGFVLNGVCLAVAINARQAANLALQKLRKQRIASHDITYQTVYGKVFVVYNPTRIPDISGFYELVKRKCLAAGYDNPVFLSTTVVEPGTKQAKEAVESGAQLVIAAGGDGTVRAVAAGLAGSSIPLGIIPTGTGNLLARNLNLPLLNIEAAVATCLTGKQSSTDLGWFCIPGHKDEPFLVMAGVGFDADIMSGVDPDLKLRIGWGAYFVSGVKAINKPPIDLEIQVGADSEPRHEKVRMLLFGSCGDLVAGLNLLPEAIPGDGWLDMLTLNVRAGIIGWSEVVSRVVLTSLGVKRKVPELTAKMKVEKIRFASVKIDGPGREVQVDGDPLGTPNQFSIRVEKQALRVRVP